MKNLFFYEALKWGEKNPYLLDRIGGEYKRTISDITPKNIITKKNLYLSTNLRDILRINLIIRMAIFMID